MKYLKKFNVRLARLMNDKKLGIDEIADICQVDGSMVQAWLEHQDKKRYYPSLDHLIDLCLKTATPLEYVLDLDPPEDGQEQLELPGLSFVEETDINQSLGELQKEIEKLLPTEEEQELLRRFRRSDAENKKLIIQLMN